MHPSASTEVIQSQVPATPDLLETDQLARKARQRNMGHVPGVHPAKHSALTRPPLGAGPSTTPSWPTAYQDTSPSLVLLCSEALGWGQRRRDAPRGLASHLLS